jgi:hypothetical protein
MIVRLLKIFIKNIKSCLNEDVKFRKYNCFKENVKIK